VAGTYGAIGALIDSHIPELSTGTVGSHHLPVRLLQSTIVFGLIGLVMLYLGLAALGALPSMVDRLSERWQPAGYVVAGVLIGGFLIGWPWPLFHKIFAHAASTHDAAYGAATFILVAVDNMLVMGLLFLVSSMTRFPNCAGPQVHSNHHSDRDGVAGRRIFLPGLLGRSTSGGVRHRVVPEDALALMVIRAVCRGNTVVGPRGRLTKRRRSSGARAVFANEPSKVFVPSRNAPSTGLGSPPFVTTDALRCCSGVNMGSPQPPR